MQIPAKLLFQAVSILDAKALPEALPRSVSHAQLHFHLMQVFGEALLRYWNLGFRIHSHELGASTIMQMFHGILQLVVSFSIVE